MADPTPASSPTPNVDTLPGLALAVTVYVLWGFLPLYMKLMSHLPTVEVIAHRIVWSLPIAGAVLLATRRTDALVRALKTPRMLGMAVVTAALVSFNWGIYVYAIQSGHALDAALGYYINPLFSVLLGAVVLGERMSLPQKLAVGLAAAAVAVLTWEAGRVPLVAVGLAVTWGFYALAKKALPIGPNQGFTLEVLILTPFALSYIVWAQAEGTGNFALTARDTWLLIGCGIVTAGPLMLYANAARGLRLSTIGVLQYIAPTIVFLIAVFVFGEPFGEAEKIAFPMIWAALAIYSMSMLRGVRTAG